MNLKRVIISFFVQPCSCLSLWTGLFYVCKQFETHQIVMKH